MNPTMQREAPRPLTLNYLRVYIKADNHAQIFCSCAMSARISTFDKSVLDNLRDKDNLSTADNTAGNKVSTIRRFTVTMTPVLSISHD